MARPPPERPQHDLWPEWYGREIPPPLDPRGEILSMSAVAGQSHVRRDVRPDEDAIRRHDRLRRIYAVYVRECIEGQYGKTPGFRDFWRGEPGNKHWMNFRAAYLAGEAGAGEDVALEDHEAWTERIMALPDGRAAPHRRHGGRADALAARDHVPDGRRGADTRPRSQRRQQGGRGVAGGRACRTRRPITSTARSAPASRKLMTSKAASPGTRRRPRTAERRTPFIRSCA